jgi:hypothetical protein
LQEHEKGVSTQHALVEQHMLCGKRAERKASFAFKRQCIYDLCITHITRGMAAVLACALAACKMITVLPPCFAKGL